MNTGLPPENAGTDFDKWLDWNGTVDQSNHLENNRQTSSTANSTSRNSYYPISPLSTSHSDHFSSSTKLQVYTAPSTVGPLTPSHSSGSPEFSSAPHARLGGDTLGDDESVFRFNNLKKRKLSSNDEMLGQEDNAPKSKNGGSKRPHNVIEKRYRANLNEKIAELRDSVPSLRVLQKARNREGGDARSDDEDLDGLTPSGKLNKASILTKAVEYIKHLECRNNRLEVENKSLKERLQTLDKVIAQGGSNAERATAFTTSKVIEQPSVSTLKQESDMEPQQKLPQAQQSLPDSWTKIRQSQQSGDHYGHVYQNTSGKARLGGKWTSRIMLGSLAGLMVIDGFTESDQGSDSREKGLFGIPVEILDGWTFLWSPRTYLETFAEYCHAGGIFPLMKGFLALTILAFFIFTYLFNSKPHPEQEKTQAVQETPQAARPASPIQVRRRAWSTSMQALRLPHHSFFPEWLAVNNEWLVYTIRYLFGQQVYACVTGRTAEDEVARSKNWDIAIDAQLAGGDIEISRSRVVLTIFGSGTLPQTPMRLMQKALHCRVLLWNMGLPGTAVSRTANYVATLFANRQWRRARQLHERLPANDPYRLPGYLIYLLQVDCDDVFNDLVTQRASNLMYDRPTSEFAEDALMDVVVEDYAIRSPLDAIAAWRSTTALREALTAAMQSPDSTDLLRLHIQAALEIAPPGSAAETRALAVHAVLSPGRRLAFYSKATESMTAVLPRPAVDTITDASVPFFIDSSTPASARPELAACLQCAKIMLQLDLERNASKALNMFVRSVNIPATYSVMTAASQFFVLHRIWRASNQGEDLAAGNSVAAALVKYFTTDAATLEHGSAICSSVVEFLRGVWTLTLAPPARSPIPSRRHSLISNDTGYGSLSEQEDEQSNVESASSSKTTAQQHNSSTVITIGT